MIEQRLEYLKTVKRAEIKERIKVAREFGDLSENAEYDAAKNEQSLTEGEILEALNYNIKPRTLDAIKRRTGSGMGRCQGGFCGEKIHEILCKYYGLDPRDILWDKETSYIVAEKVGDAQ